MAVAFEDYKKTVHKTQQDLFEKCLDVKYRAETLSWGLDLSKGLLYIFLGRKKLQRQLFRMEIMGIFDRSQKTFTWSWCQFPGHLSRATRSLRKLGRKRNTWQDLCQPILHCDFQLIKEYALWVSFLCHFSFFLPLEVEKNVLYIVLCSEESKIKT